MESFKRSREGGLPMGVLPQVAAPKIVGGETPAMYPSG